MALNIPLPGVQGDVFGKALDSGSAMLTHLMNPILKREDMARQWRQHLDALALQKAAAGRASQAASDAHKLAMNKLDPTFEAKQYEALENYWRNRGNPGAMQGQIPQDPIPSQEMGEGMGMFTPEGLQGAQEVAQQPAQQTAAASNISGPNLELMKAHPMLRGWYKKHFGQDPLAIVPQTPEEKAQTSFDLFKQKEQYKAEQKLNTEEQEPKLPAAIKTLHENIIHLSPKAVKAIQHIIDIPSPFEPWGMGAFYSGQKAAHNKAVTAAAENYSKAKGWPNTKGSIEKAESILQRGKFETDHDYRKRLREYQDELEEGIQSSSQFLHPTQEKQESQKPENNVIEYVRINGKLVPKGAS